MLLNKRILLLALIGLTHPLAASASSLEDGVKLYSAKNYVKAKIELEKAVKEKDNSWQAHLYLAHTFLALGNFTHAKYQYQLCQRLTNNAAVQGQCSQGITRAEEYLEKRKSASNSGSGSTSTSTSTSSGKKETASAKEDDGEAEVSPKEKRRKAIMAEAKEQMDKIRADAKKQLEDEKNQSQEVFRYSDGSRGTDISDEREKEIMHEAEEKCKKIKEQAEIRARG